MSKKAVKLGSFFECSIHVFLGDNGSFKKPYQEELLSKAWSM